VALLPLQMLQLYPPDAHVDLL